MFNYRKANNAINIFSIAKRVSKCNVIYAPIKVIIVAIAFCVVSLHAYSQVQPSKQSKLIVQLKNAPFNSLALLDYRDFHNVAIIGKQIGESKWEFTVPDSIIDNSEFMMLIVPHKDTVANAYRQVRFNTEFKNRKNTIVNFGIQEKTTYLNAEYKGKEIFENDNIASFLGRTDTVITGNLICDDFNLSLKNDSSDITVRSIDPYYAWFDGGNNKLSYEDNLKFYIKMAKDYPDSKYLLTSLSQNLSRFKNRQDIKMIYQTFSDKHKNTKWARRIELFLSDKFYNISLINVDTKKIEPLVQDSSKYTLVIFSASWCGPCKEEIPLLKELYKNLKARFNFTYISVDYEKRVKAFQDVLIKYNIPWRTLYAYQDLNRVEDLFSVKSIPRTCLFYPDGHMEVIDVRNKENQKKLYLLNKPVN